MSGNQFALNTALQGDLVLNPNAVTVQRQCLYDHAIYPAAGATSIELFQPVSVGQTAFSGAPLGARTTAFDTNFAGGLMPNGQKFVANGLEIYYEAGTVPTVATGFKSFPRGVITADITGTSTYPTLTGYARTTLDEIIDFYNNTIVEFRVSSALIVAQKAIHFLPEVAHRLESCITNVGTETGILSMLNHYIAGDPFDFGGKGVEIGPQTNVSVTLKYPYPLATVTGNNARIYTRLTGTFGRAGV